jgi:hypothetical protein
LVNNESLRGGLSVVWVLGTTVRVSFAHTRVSIVGWIYYPDHSLRPGIYVDVPHLDCLLVAAPITENEMIQTFDLCSKVAFCSLCFV